MEEGERSGEHDCNQRNPPTPERRKGEKGERKKPSTRLG